MKKINKFISVFPIFILLFFLFSCSNNIFSRDYTVKNLKVAVIIPYDEGSDLRRHYQQTINMFLENYTFAQKNLTKRINFVLEYYNESTENLDALGEELSKREDIIAVIGPISSINVDKIAQHCKETEKTIITPTASSEDLVRRYAVSETGSVRSPFLWSLAETDVAQSEALLSKVLSYGGKSVSLISSNDLYGNTFYNWIPFQAYEMELEIKENVQVFTEQSSDYSSNLFDFNDAVDKVFNSDADYIICALSKMEMITEVLRRRSTSGKSIPPILFTDTAFKSSILDGDYDVEGVEGLALYSDPATGFEVTYREQYGESTINGEAQLYDCFLLLGTAALYCNYIYSDITNPFCNENINKAIKMYSQIENGDIFFFDWTKYGMRDEFTIFKIYEEENIFFTDGIMGASGAIVFDEEIYTTKLYSVYSHWIVFDNEFVVTDYTIADEDNRVSPNVVSWNWNIQKKQEFNSFETDNNYSELKDKWAVLISGSKGWYNYRHQADVLHIYSILKENGFDDDHIILIIEDDIAFNTRNKIPGEIKTSIDGIDLYTDEMERRDGSIIDYNTSELSPDKFKEILLGNISGKYSKEELPVVLNSNENSNIFIFWSGHGNNRNGDPSKGQFEWLSNIEGFSTELMRETFLQMQENKRYRKVLFVAETCYSLSVLKGIEGIEGVLGFAAANGTETSFADVYGTDLKVWLSNRFTRNFVEKIVEDPRVKYVDLYEHMFKNTLGSHVSIINEEKFSNLYNSDISEFIIY